MAANATDRKTATVQTTTADVTTLLTYAHPDASGAVIQAVVTAYDGSGNVKGWLMELVTKRVAGTLSAVGSLQSLMTAQGDAGLATAVAIITTSGTNVIVQVTGIALTTINWRARVEVDLLTP